MLCHFFTAIYAGLDKFRIQQQFWGNVKSSNVKKKCNLFQSLKKLDDKGNVLFEGWLACQVCLGAICRKTTFEINVGTKGKSRCMTTHIISRGKKENLPFRTMLLTFSFLFSV